ncbi:MAG: polysaccharide deacetylase [Clostridia bacterium]|nr:polysaccharide deacetylase [Clostridia bacterium]
MYGRQNVNKIYQSDTKRAFLTFDDGPSSVTPKILDILKQEKVKATFFVLGSRVEVMPETTKRIYQEGHYIASHGYSHIYSQIYASPESVLEEYNRCNEEIKKAIGINEYNSHLFRFPGGLVGGKYATIKDQAKELLSQNEVLHIDWNALTGDAETNNLSIEFELKRLQETTENKNSVVILLHDAPAKSVTADALPQIINQLKERGYEFKNFYEIIE